MPLVLLYPYTLWLYDDYILVLDIIWVLNIVIKLQTIRPDKPTDSPLSAAGIYIVTDFIYDLVATLPPILSRFNSKVFILRFLHIREI